MAAQVRRAFKAGRPQKTDQHLTGIAAVAIATQQLKDLRDLMVKSGLKPEHAVAWLVVTHPKTGPERIFITPARVEERIALLLSPDVQTLGIVFGQYEAAESKKFFWSKHFLTDAESLRIVEAARQACEADAALKNWN